ncbi:89_t:CDS:1, partial [Funneliformis caledonium]
DSKFALLSSDHDLFKGTSQNNEQGFKRLLNIIILEKKDYMTFINKILKNQKLEL